MTLDEYIDHLTALRDAHGNIEVEGYGIGTERRPAPVPEKVRIGFDAPREVTVLRKNAKIKTRGRRVERPGTLPEWKPAGSRDGQHVFEGAAMNQPNWTQLDRERLAAIAAAEAKGEAKE